MHDKDKIINLLNQTTIDTRLHSAFINVYIEKNYNVERIASVLSEFELLGTPYDEHWWTTTGYDVDEVSVVTVVDTDGIYLSYYIMPTLFFNWYYAAISCLRVVDLQYVMLPSELAEILHTSPFLKHPHSLDIPLVCRKYGFNTLDFNLSHVVRTCISFPDLKDVFSFIQDKKLTVCSDLVITEMIDDDPYAMFNEHNEDGS